MSDAPLDRLKAVYERWALGDFSTTRELVAPDVEWHQSPTSVEPGVRHGHDGVERIVRGVFEAFSDFRVVADEFLRRGPTVVVVAHVQGEAKLTGLPLDRVMAQVWRFEDGRAVRVEWYPSREEALEAAAG